jgi:hypothetical protein
MIVLLLFTIYNMKNIKSLILLFLLTTVGLGACQKDIVFVEGSGPGSTTPPVNTVMMSTKVNGNLVNCDLATAQFDQSSGTLQVIGIKGQEAFTFTFQNFKGVGTYNAADFTSFANYTNGIADPLVNSFFADSGTIKITSTANNFIKGTFEFNATNTVGDVKTITEGVFTIKL